jgi:hypothetical protein
MGTLDSEDRQELRDSQFAYIDSDGERHLPVHDEAHARNAVARFGQTDFESRTAKRDAARKVLRAAERHGVEVGDDTEVRKAAGS